MQTLKVLVIVMGVLIVGGTATLGVLIVRRLSAIQGPATTTTLDEPAGTRIAGVAATQDRTLITLQGGGPDRVVSVDSHTGKLLGTISLGK